MSNDARILDLSFLTLSQKYLHTAKSILEQMVATGNPWMPAIEIDNKEDMWEEYFKITKWSDFEVIIPTLFLFFHGLELLTKGLLFLANNNNINNFNLDHKLSVLYNAVEKDYCNNSELVSTLKKYSYLINTTPAIIHDFINYNKEIKDIDGLYESLRYPSNKQSQTAFKYTSMKYKEKEGLPFAQELIKDIDFLLRQSVKIHRAGKQ
jgi:hypothetical protein